jgi:amino acid transporter
MQRPADSTRILADDVRTLQRLGYAQELRRRLNAFSNYAVSLSIICILAGCITSFPQALCSVGGAAVGVAWPLCALLSLAFAATMGQVASAFPTAGGLYHWASILGGRGWGWVTAWFNLGGLIIVLAAINVGTYQFTLGSLGRLLGFDPKEHTETALFFLQVAGVVTITFSQALINHRGIRLTARFTDFSGYWILIVALALTVCLLWASRDYDFGRLVTFSNFSGLPQGGPDVEPIWPRSESLLWLFALSFIMPAYTITGFDASAHISEETVGAAHNVPRALVRAVLVSGIFGWIMLCAVVLAAPNLQQAAAQGNDAFFWILEQVHPGWLSLLLYAGIAVAQYLCGLATVTSTSRMAYAFARDGGLPFSPNLRQVHAVFRTPVYAIWTTALLAVAFMVYTPVYSTITTASVIFLYVSYAIPTVLGLFAYGRTWTRMGPWTLGPWYRVLAVICGLGAVFFLVIGVQPPNDKALWIVLGAAVLTALYWFAIERYRFAGPPQGLLDCHRQPEIAVGEKGDLIKTARTVPSAPGLPEKAI